MRTLTVALALTVVLAVIVPCVADQGAGQAQFARIAKLEGTWTGKAGDQDVTIAYRVTSGGTAVLETIQGGCDAEMVTLYYLDKGALVLTHYCALGNQPHMVAKTGSEGEIRFECVEGAPLDAEKATHMHAAKIAFVGEDRIETAWTLHQDGAAAGEHAFTLARRK